MQLGIGHLSLFLVSTLFSALTSCAHTVVPLPQTVENMAFQIFIL